MQCSLVILMWKYGAIKESQYALMSPLREEHLYQNINGVDN